MPTGLAAPPWFPPLRPFAPVTQSTQDAPFGVAAMHPDDIRTATATTGTAVSVAKPPRLRDGDGVLFIVYDQIAASTVTQSNTGMTEAYHTTQASTRGFYLFTKANVTAASEPGSYTATLSNSGRWVAMVLRVPAGYTTLVDVAPGSDTYNGSVGSTLAPPSITNNAAGALALACLFANGTSSTVSTFSSPGWALAANVPVNNAGSTSAVSILQKTIPAGGTATADTFTADQNYASAGGFVITLWPASSAPVAITATGSLELAGSGTAVDGNTTSATGSLTFSGSATAAAPASAAGALTLSGAQSTAVQQFIARTPMNVAHRGFDGNNPEETMQAYNYAAAWNSHLALEVSVWQTSDGVYVCSHDQTTGRVFSGTSVDITTVTWASISGKTTLSGGLPIARIDDVLTAYGGQRVIFVDNKGSQNNSTLLDMLDAAGGPGWFVCKQFQSGSTWPAAARARGYTTWGYYFAADVPSLPTTQARWDLLGMDILASSSDWTAALSYGKAVLGHTPATWADRGTALGFGASGVMATSSAAVPNDTETGTGSLTLSGTATASFPASGSLTFGGAGGAAAAASGSGALSLSGASAGKAAVTATGAVALSGAATGVAAATGSGAVTLSGSASGQAVASATGAVTLAGTATAAAPVTAAGALTFTATANMAATGTGAGSLILSGSVTIGATPASGSGALTLAGIATAAFGGTGSGAITFTSAGTAGSLASGAGALLLAAVAVAVARGSGTGSITFTATATATGGGGIPPGRTPPERTSVVLAENRTVTITADTLRTAYVPAETRTVTV